MVEVSIPHQSVSVVRSLTPKCETEGVKACPMSLKGAPLIIRDPKTFWECELLPTATRSVRRVKTKTDEQSPEIQYSVMPVIKAWDIPPPKMKAGGGGQMGGRHVRGRESSILVVQQLNSHPSLFLKRIWTRGSRQATGLQRGDEPVMGGWRRKGEKKEKIRSRMVKT